MIGFNFDVLPYDEIGELFERPGYCEGFLLIWSYRCSKSDIDREVNATGF